MARVFAVMVQILLSAGAIAVQIRSKPVNYHGTGFLLGHWRSVAPKALTEAKRASWGTNLIGSRCACPGARTITNLSRV